MFKGASMCDMCNVECGHSTLWYIIHICKRWDLLCLKDNEPMEEDESSKQSIQTLVGEW